MKKSLSAKTSDKLFNYMVYFISISTIVLTLYPMYFILIASISNPLEVSVGNILFFPKGINFEGYRKLFDYKQLLVGYRNTILYVIFGTLFSLSVNIPVAYALSRKDFIGRKFFIWYFLIPMFFNGGLIPTYITVKNFGLLDTMLVMVMPFSVITYYIIVARTFFDTSLPKEIYESAQMDGCGNIRYFFRFVIPLSKAIIAVVALWTAVGQWNSYFNALIYLQSEELRPLQLVLRNILINSKVVGQFATGTAAVEAKKAATLIKYCAIVVSSAPIMSMYPFVQKYFNKGVMIGSLKG